MRFRRRRYITEYGLQMKAVLAFAIASLMGSIAASAAFSFLALKELEKIMWTTHISIKTTGDVLRPLFIYISVIDLIFVSFLVVVISMWMLKKTSGPLYRMSQDIVKISQGDLTLNINLREKDEFKEVAQELNSALKNIKKLFRALNEKYSRVSASIIEVQKESAGSGAIRSDFSTVLARIEELEAEFRPLKFGKKQ